MRVRHLERAPDDGYENPLVPGLRSSEDARRLAGALTASGARLESLSLDPPGLLGLIASEPDVEEAAWLAFQVAYIGELDGDDPFAEVDRVRVSWRSGELPDLEGAELGPRTAHDPARALRTLEAYRAWAAKAGSQQAALTGDPSLSPQRRFDQLWTRLALPGFHRQPRFEFLVLASRLGLADVEPWSLKFQDASAASPVGLAARRVFGTGDALELQRRATRLMAAAGLPMAALDRALWEWGRGGGRSELGRAVAEALGVSAVAAVSPDAIDDLID